MDAEGISSDIFLPKRIQNNSEQFETSAMSDQESHIRKDSIKIVRRKSPVTFYGQKRECDIVNPITVVSSEQSPTGNDAKPSSEEGKNNSSHESCELELQGENDRTKSSVVNNDFEFPQMIPTRQVSTRTCAGESQDHENLDNFSAPYHFSSTVEDKTTSTTPSVDVVSGFPQILPVSKTSVRPQAGASQDRKKFGNSSASLQSNSTCQDQTILLVGRKGSGKTQALTTLFAEDGKNVADEFVDITDRGHTMHPLEYPALDDTNPMQQMEQLELVIRESHKDDASKQIRIVWYFISERYTQFDRTCIDSLTALLKVVVVIGHCDRRPHLSTIPSDAVTWWPAAYLEMFVHTQYPSLPVVQVGDPSTNGWIPRLCPQGHSSTSFKINCSQKKWNCQFNGHSNINRSGRHLRCTAEGRAQSAFGYDVLLRTTEVLVSSNDQNRLSGNESSEHSEARHRRQGREPRGFRVLLCFTCALAMMRICSARRH